jgi:transcription elongation factor GreA
MLKFTLHFMEKNIKITKEAKEAIEGKKREFEKNLKANPENVALQKDILEISEFLDTVIMEEENEPALVKIGSKILVENLSSGDRREYQIMTRHTANPLSGVISNESPLAQRILGLKLGNTFKFIEGSNSEQTFKIKTIY